MARKKAAEPRSSAPTTSIPATIGIARRPRRGTRSTSRSASTFAGCTIPARADARGARQFGLRAAVLRRQHPLHDEHGDRRMAR